MPATNSETRALIIVNGRCLIPGEGLVETNIRCENGIIASIGTNVPKRGSLIHDADGAIVLPGIVDIHGDAFERQIMPRPKTLFPVDIALLDTDRQLVSNGITTAYHGVTVSWEPGLRSLGSARAIITALDSLEPRLGADNRLHLRWETFALDTIDDVTKLFSRSKKPVLAFNDHTTPSMVGLRAPTKLQGAAERAQMDVDDYMVAMQRIWSRRDDVPQGLERIAGAARTHGVPLLSHDDRTAKERTSYRALGAVVTEFPMTEDALEAAHRGADPVVLGAPNVMRGRSHNGALDATAAVRSGRCSILASDYYYPAPLHAALKIAGDDLNDMEKAWALVSRNPARAAGLDDRGDLAQGLRADLIVVDDQQVTFAVVAGRPAMQFDSTSKR
ncbi:MAG: alpha-D-ribose 1-methylphosphonate 5-triphosphate diphosphatase [Aestuariivirga sp.]